MNGLDRPSFGSDDVKGERSPGGTIALTCQSCQTSWGREGPGPVADGDA